MATGETAEQGGVCWASLPAELAELIAARVLAAGGGGVDYVRFRATAALLDPRLHPGVVRWMMFRPLPGPPCARRPRPLPRPLRLRTHPIRVPLPLLRGHCVLDYPDGLLLLERELPSIGGNSIVCFHAGGELPCSVPSWHRLFDIHSN
uniref:Uncharacterized protein n=1 Tax=Oryza meridionalis TaxID=40149 RepID=A0A0E0E846_9ORYZ